MNWRAQLISNRRKTYVIMVSFIFMYFILGSVVALMLTPHYGIDDWVSILKMPHSQIIILSFVSISLFIILIGVLFGGKLSLAGTNSVEITQNSENPDHRQLYNVVEEMKIAARMRFMPRIYVLNVGYMNAFASGWHEKNAVVAISKPL